VRGRGLLLALDTLHADATAVAARAFDFGLLLNAPRTNTLRFVPALTVSEREIDEMLSLLDQVLGYLKKHSEPE